MKLFDLFKKKNKDIISYDLNTIFSNKKVFGWGDVYEAIGMMDAVKTINEKETGKYHYKNVRANENTIRKIEDLTLNNLTKTKNKFSKMYKPEYLKRKHAMDSLCWAPFSDKTIKDDIIVMLLPEHKDFTKGFE